MLNVKNLEDWELVRMAGMYTYGQLVFGNNLQKFSDRKLKRTKKHLCKAFAYVIPRLSTQMQQFFLPEADAHVLFAFLQECHQERERRDAARWASEKIAMEPLGKVVIDAIERARDDTDMDDAILTIRQQQGQTWLQMQECEAFSLNLVLENAILSPQVAQRGYVYCIYEVKREGEWTVFREWGESGPQEALRFTAAKVHLEHYDCTKQTLAHGSLLCVVYLMAHQILRKSEIPGDYCNEREKALLPLLQEINQPYTLQEHPNLRQLAQQVGCNMSKLDRLLKKKKGFYPWESPLAKAEYEPLFRTVLEKIRHSQEGYPSQAELLCDPQTVTQKRTAVTEFFHDRGFLGEYPEFHKTADIPGYHMVPGQTGKVLYCRVKNAQMFIRCEESAVEGQMRLCFQCGRALTGKRPPVQDFLSCCCQDRGYRWSENVWELTNASLGGDRTLEAAAVAVKKVQLQKLTKKEQAHYGTYMHEMDRGTKIALAIPVITIPVLLMVVSGILAISGEWAELAKMMVEFPWWEVLAVYGTIYGLPFALFVLIARRR